ncbi:hypothetical protein [Teredinibacter sp. KSP-S5-2]|uniref:hypothetical protein n=1 Tax=Teredinibacter sp. KSP-S5-2 TaxID=3034506 RepID=UPI0029345436|nr:hypothetical protein [Teredinibacter sp. KSP-S5-2]WNO07855.1 hypothetical protein P5V12_12775 [Teredinibacter sp. KSP-S5-2]
MGSKYLGSLVQGFDKKRPNLGDYIKRGGKIIAIANSDIVIPVDFYSALVEFEETDAILAGTQRYDVPEELFDDQLLKNQVLVGRYFKLQSKRTVDLFAIRTEFFHELSDTSPGTVGFDSGLLAHAYSTGGKVLDMSRRFKVYHKHHEDFRVPFSNNFIVELNDQADFSEGRKAEYSKRWYGGCLSRADYMLNAQRGRLKKRHFPHIRLKLESLKIRTVNYIDRVLFSLNRSIVRFFLRFSTLSSRPVQLTILSLFRYRFVLPSLFNARGVEITPDSGVEDLMRSVAACELKSVVSEIRQVNRI